MARSSKTPADLARRLASPGAPEVNGGRGDGWERQTYRLSRLDAHATAKDWFERFPRDAYRTEVESWRVLGNGLIEFTMRRLSAAD